MPSKPQITLAINEQTSPPQMVIYGHGFASQYDFEQIAEKIYLSLLKEDSITELKSDETIAHEASNNWSILFGKKIKYQGVINRQWFNKIKHKAKKIDDVDVTLDIIENQSEVSPDVSFIDCTLEYPNGQKVIETMIAMAKPDRTFFNHVNEFLKEHNHHELKKYEEENESGHNQLNKSKSITLQKTNKKKYRYYSQGAEFNDVADAVEYATMPCVIKTNHKLTLKEIASSLNPKLYFNGENIKKPGNQSILGDKNSKKANKPSLLKVKSKGTTSLIIEPKKQVYNDADINLLVHAMCELATRVYQKTHEPFVITITATYDTSMRILRKIQQDHAQYMPDMAFKNMQIQVTYPNIETNNFLKAMHKYIPNNEDSDSSSTSTNESNYRPRKPSYRV